MSHIVMLKNLGACIEGLQYASQYDTLQAAWDACNNPSFMLWLLEKQNREKDLHRCACVFAKSVLHLYEAQHPGDTRVRVAIECKERWLTGQVTDAELAAAEDAAWAAWAAAAEGADRKAVESAARAAAEDAARAAAGAAGAAEDAARAAAWAAWGADRKAVESAARAAAARDAAWDAAWAAARDAAWDAAWAAAGDAAAWDAGAAAGDAAAWDAGAAAGTAQCKQIRSIVPYV